MTAIKEKGRLLLAIFLIFIVLSCTKQKEEGPFYDGLYLKYNETFSKSEKPEDTIWEREIIYRFKHVESGEFHIAEIVTSKMGKWLDNKIETIPFPEVGDDLTINNQGTVLKGGNSFNFMNEYPSYLWLPADKRKKGVEIIKISRILASINTARG